MSGIAELYKRRLYYRYVLDYAICIREHFFPDFCAQMGQVFLLPK